MLYGKGQSETSEKKGFCSKIFLINNGETSNNKIWGNFQKVVWNKLIESDSKLEFS